MGDNIPGERFLSRNFLGWNAPRGNFLSGSFSRGNFLSGSFSRGNFPRTEYIKCILKCVDTYALLMKFCCKTEILMLQINTNLTL